MKRIHLLIFFTLFLFNCKTQKESLVKTDNRSNYLKLSSIKNVVSVEKMKSLSHFDENYEIWFEQPIDHNDASKGTFKQRVFLGFEDVNNPVIVELRGYSIGSAKAGELANHYTANQLTIEHRYFNNSRPKDIDWNTLTVENAAKDQARIINAIRNTIFPNSKFISTGISKGCQTTMAHRRYFPDNVDASVCYVGPLNFQREDPRVYEFLSNVGTESDRQKIKAFQELCFKNRAALLEKMKSAAKAQNLNWEFGIENAIDYTILEYSFAFWQWGNKIKDIPNASASIDQIYKHLIAVSGYGFFEEKAVANLQPYFWAALTEQGIYGYKTNAFKNYFDNKSTVLDFEWAFPEGVSKSYNLKPMQDIKNYLDRKAEDIVFIYGEYDPWSATAVDLSKSASKREVYKYVYPKGDHKTRIKSFSPEKQKEIYDIIDGWIEE